MPRRTITLVTCSFCQKETEEGTGGTTAAKLNGYGQQLSYDICEDCRTGNPVYLNFIEYGERPRPQRRPPVKRLSHADCSHPATEGARKKCRNERLNAYPDVEKER